MFNNDVTQTYNHQDATLEILVMLTGAFLLGCLLCWLIRSLLKIDKKAELASQSNHDTRHTKSSFDDQHHSSNDSIAPQAFTSNSRNKAHVVKRDDLPATSTTYSTPKIDDLTKISGLTSKMALKLKNNGIKSFIDLRDIDKQTLFDALEVSETNSVNKETQTWPHQASLAAKGEWKKLSEYQSFIKRTIATTKTIQDQNDSGIENEDLKKIEGIGPKIEEILNNEDIHTYKDLRKSDRDTLKAYLDKAGSRFEKHEPETWPLQAGMAERGEWEELKIYQEFMDDDSALFVGSKTDMAPNIASSSTSPDKSSNDIKNTKTDNKQDDLKKIDGIGPKIQSILNKKGINTYKDLRKSNRKTLKSYLDAAGNQFKLHEPETWPHQAGLAEEGKWKELDVYQDYMQQVHIESVKSSELQNKESNQKSLHIKDVSDTESVKNIKKDEADDLKKIEGIGPKIEELLHKAGIRTFKNLGDCSSTTIKDLLDAAGPQFRMHNPDTWPHQAKMAVKGEWKELKEYQDFLLGGRE